jgi:hypothetical protein
MSNIETNRLSKSETYLMETALARKRDLLVVRTDTYDSGSVSARAFSLLIHR